MSHPDPSGPPDLRPIEPGEVLENPVTRERAVIIELPWQNEDGRASHATAFDRIAPVAVARTSRPGCGPGHTAVSAVVLTTRFEPMCT